jgi:AraC family transcriptional regulator
MSMEYQEVEKPSMKFVGFGVDTSVQDAKKDCPKVWQEFMKSYKEIKNYMGGMKNYGVGLEKSKEQCTFRYVACAQVSEFEDIPKGAEKTEVPESKYFIFLHKGKLDKIGDTYSQITAELKKQGKKEKAFWIEFYDHRWKGDTEDSILEIWIPIH